MSVRSYDDAVDYFSRSNSNSYLEITDLSNTKPKKPVLQKNDTHKFPLGEALRGNSRVRHISLYRVFVSVSLARDLAHGWLNDRQLIGLRLSHSTFNSGTSSILVRSIGTMQKLDDFAIWHCKAGDEDLAKLLRVVGKVCPSVFKFGFKSSSRKHVAWNQFWRAVRANDLLKTLKAECFGLSKILKTKFRHLGFCNSLRSLDLTKTVLSDDGSLVLFRAFQRLMEQGKDPLEVTLNGCGLTDFSLYALFQHYKASSWFLQFYCAKNNFTTVGYKCLANGISRAEVLQRLKILDHSAVDITIATHIAAGVRENNSLKHLFLIGPSFYNNSYCSWKSIPCLLELTTLRPALRITGF